MLKFNVTVSISLWTVLKCELGTEMDNYLFHRDRHVFRMPHCARQKLFVSLLAMFIIFQIWTRFSRTKYCNGHCLLRVSLRRKEADCTLTILELSTLQSINKALCFAHMLNDGVGRVTLNWCAVFSGKFSPLAAGRCKCAGLHCDRKWRLPRTTHSLPAGANSLFIIRWQTQVYSCHELNKLMSLAMASDEVYCKWKRTTHQIGRALRHSLNGHM